ncbi:SDR family NAD(P)-dependent oxidoreductase [Rhizobium sp. C4]|uniref:SDR family NAD(P)-dependent oxidoreductase n=1 Tax=Rhizobium sp. C4 TaxID=1349800 RepID=UPI001E4F3629|nr:SDR family NAD(P)-dependent oxidoreductase [Rhizobium sp. C4]MCD2172222.1 SDR family oxidoreductase [Rhizobium sp. C4]
MTTAQLSGKRVIVTGAASGIGLAAAALFEAEGAIVARFDRDAKGLEAAKGQGPCFVVDQTDAEAVRLGVAQAAEALGGLDGLLNAAGIADTTPTAALTLERWNTVLAVNLTGPFLMSQAALPFLSQSPASAIVNIASASGLLPSGAGSVYGTSKAGVLMLTKSLAAEWGPAIRVNAICPGTVDTNMLNGLFEKDEAFFERIKKTYALQRLATAEEIAKAALFLISDQSSFVTGVSLAVDGGRTFH